MGFGDMVTWRDMTIFSHVTPTTRATLGFAVIGDMVT